MKPEVIRPGAYVALRLPSDQLLVVQAQPNTTISVGKYGTFQANHIIGRPYYLTFEILDKTSNEAASKTGLRVVPAHELHANINEEDVANPAGIEDGDISSGQDGVQYDIVGEDGNVVMRTNRQIIDDPNSQVLTMDEIEDMKAKNTGSGRELVAKILESHSALDQKTAFALAKYTLRKTKKYLRRFTTLPLDVSMVAQWIFTEKEPMKIMELKEEILALIGSWSNVHCTHSSRENPPENGLLKATGGKWLVIDETAGLIVAYMAEKMGILHPHEDFNQGSESRRPDNNTISGEGEDVVVQPRHQLRPHKHSISAIANTITLIHANSQPNLSLLKYFHFDAFNPSGAHPLESHLKTLSWLQLLAPEDDAGCTEPEAVSEETLQSWKSSKKSNYFRKRRRWERIKAIVDETRAGGYNGLIVASVMSPVSILRHTVPLLRGGAQVVVYSPTIEPLVELADYYSTGRRTAFVSNPPDPARMPTEDFPLNPTLLLAPTIHTARCRPWQVLPGRTHPLMTGRGGSEGYIFTATRVLPAEGKVEARGKAKRRKVESETTPSSSQVETPVKIEDVAVNKS
ncbi:tRNA (adenine58-N1)-methyltransferase non-catalytic subunit, partial [Lecanoromycetidae sp. Uapishka_2]